MKPGSQLQLALSQRLGGVNTCRHEYFLSCLCYHDKYTGNSQLEWGSCVSGYLGPRTCLHGLNFLG